VVAIVLILVAFVMIKLGLISPLTIIFYITVIVMIIVGIRWLYKSLSPSRLLGLKREEDEGAGLC
jgi:hypothetical protein